MKLAATFMVSFFVISLVLSSVLVSYSNFRILDILNEEVEDNLFLVAQDRTRHVLEFLDEQEEKTHIIAEKVIFEEYLQLKERSPRDLEIIKIELQEILHEEFKTVSLADIDGTILISTNQLLVEEKLSPERFPINEREDFVKMYYHDLLKENVLELTHLMVDDETKELIGMLGIHISLSEFNEILEERLGKWKTRETYLIDQDGILLTPSRFLRGKNKGVLVQLIDSENSRECIGDLEEHGIEAFEKELKEIEKGEEVLRVYNNYRGAKVFGVHFPISSLNWCLLAEVEYDEAVNLPLTEFVSNQIIISIIAIFILTSVGFFVGRLLDKKKPSKNRGVRKRRQKK